MLDDGMVEVGRWPFLGLKTGVAYIMGLLQDLFGREMTGWMMNERIDYCS